MGNPTGYRRGTRDMFARDYKKKGVEHLSTYLKTYKIGTLLTSEAAELSRRASLTRLTKARLVVSSTCLSVL